MIKSEIFHKDLGEIDWVSSDLVEILEMLQEFKPGISTHNWRVVHMEQTHQKRMQKVVILNYN